MLLADSVMAILQLHVAIAESERTGFYGRWVGHYSTGQQIVEIEQRGIILIARKLTGDAFVRAGEVTWVVFLDDMQAYGIVAVPDSKDTSAVRGRIAVINHYQIVFYWKNIERERVVFRRLGSMGML